MKKTRKDRKGLAKTTMGEREEEREKKDCIVQRTTKENERQQSESNRRFQWLGRAPFQGHSVMEEQQREEKDERGAATPQWLPHSSFINAVHRHGC